MPPNSYDCSPPHPNGVPENALTHDRQSSGSDHGFDVCEAESIHRESLRDENQITYALVSIKNGDAVLKDVFIDATSIREIVKERQQNDH